MWSLDYRTHAQCQGSVPSEELSIRSIDAFLSMSYDCPAHGWCCLPATPYVLNLILIYIYIKGVSNYLTWKYTQISVTFRRLRLHQDAYIHNINLILRTWPPLFSSHNTCLAFLACSLTRIPTPTPLPPSPYCAATQSCRRCVKPEKTHQRALLDRHPPSLLPWLLLFFFKHRDMKHPSHRFFLITVKVVKIITLNWNCMSLSRVAMI